MPRSFASSSDNGGGGGSIVVGVTPSDGTANTLLKTDGSGTVDNAAGLTNPSSGNLTATGVITAAQFVGSAAALNTFQIFADMFIGINSASMYHRAGGYQYSDFSGNILMTVDPTLVTIQSTAAAGAAIQLREMTAPSAPAANDVRIYSQDNGAGKTQLMALFASGAAQQIAIEP